MKKLYNVEEAKVITSKLVKKHGEDLKRELLKIKKLKNNSIEYV